MYVCGRARTCVCFAFAPFFHTPRTCAGVYDPDFQFFVASKFFRENLSAGAGTSSRRAFSRGANFAAVCIRHYEARGNPGVLLHGPERYRAESRDDAINNAPPCEVANNKCERTKFYRMKV